MRLTTVKEAQENLPELVEQAKEETVGLTDDDGNLVGLISGVNDDEIDDLLVQTSAFRTMIARSRASLNSGHPVSAKDLLAEVKEHLRSGNQGNVG
jgi:hypothetical protein